MNLTRRSFLVGSGALAVLPAFPDGPVRLGRVGLMTDTHVRETPASCGRVKAALELFREQGVEMVVNCGDIADFHCVPGYRAYRQTFNAVYPDAAKRPKEVYVYANHDLYGVRGAVAAKFARVQAELEAPNGPVAAFDWKGFPFLVFPQSVGRRGFPSWADYEAAVAKACRENPGKPVFVLDHVPPAGTTYHSRHWGCVQSRRVLNRFPQVVSISGHVHGSLAGERQVWQGEFTAVNVGCLQTWAGFASGSTPPRQEKENYGVLVMDIYADRLEFVRYDVRDRSELGPAWVVQRATVGTPRAPYRPENAVRRLSRAAFAPGSSVAVAPDGDGYRVTFDEVRTGADAFMYRIEVAHREDDGEWTVHSRDDVFGDFWKAKSERTGRVSYRLDAALFNSGEENRVTVTPLDWFGRPTAPVAAVVRADVAPAAVWHDDLLMGSCTFTEHGRPVTLTTGGRFAPASGQGTLHLPEHVFKPLWPGARHRLVMALDSVQPDGDWCGWRVTLNRRGGRKSLATVQNAAGAPGPLRYVFDFRVPSEGLDTCDILFNFASPGSSLKVLALTLL